MKPVFIVGVATLAVVALASLASPRNGVARFGAWMILAAAVAAWGSQEPDVAGTSSATTAVRASQRCPPPSTPPAPPHNTPPSPTRHSRLSVHDALSAPLARSDVAPLTEDGTSDAQRIRLQRDMRVGRRGSGKPQAPAPTHRMAFGALHKVKHDTRNVPATAQDISEQRTRTLEEYVAVHSTMTPEDYAANMQDERRQQRLFQGRGDQAINVDRTPLTLEEVEAYKHHVPQR